MKWIGLLLILFTCTWVGLERSNRFRSRTKQLKEFIQALQLMEAEITYGQAPLESVFKQLQERLTAPVSTFFESVVTALHQPVDDTSLQQIWTKQVKTFHKELALSSKDQQILIQFGQSLGLHDLEQQRKQINLTAIHLHKALDDATDEEKRFAGMSRTLGFLTGVLIVIVLI